MSAKMISLSVPDRSKDRHKSNPRTVRLPEGLQAWLDVYAAAADQPVNAVIVQALRDFQDRNTSRQAP